jgi:formylmethanofuran dehydrogenase subunit A
MENSQAKWIDSTVANLSDLAPIRHSSYNSQRDMVLIFNKTITGFYNDKSKQNVTLIKDSPVKPLILAWLPLNEGYQKDINIYDYNPAATIGVIIAHLKKVESGTFKSEKSGIKKVWVLTVTDEIVNSPESFMTYYIDKSDRTLWKLEVNIGARRMMMLRQEF